MNFEYKLLFRSNLRRILSSASVPSAGVRLTEFSFCGETSPHVVYALAAKTEFCKPDPSTRNAGA
jgi:hypothetical protein